VHPAGKTIRWIEKWMTPFMMGTTSSITVQSLGKIVQRALAVGVKMWCWSLCLLPARCREAATCRYCFYSVAKNQYFAPSGKLWIRSKNVWQLLWWARRALPSCKVWGEIGQRTPAGGAKMWCLFFCSLPVGLPRSGKLPVLFLLTGQKSGFSPRRGDSLHRFRSNFAWPTSA